MSNARVSPSSSNENVRNQMTPPMKMERPIHRETVPTMHQQPIEQNWWWKYRQMIREAAAEFTGVMLLVIFGSGVNCQVGLSSNPGVAASPKGDYLSVSFGWAVGLSIGVWVSAGISGGHVNPAVTLSLAIFRGFPWRKVPVYMISQLLGGIVGAAIVYANYFHAIDIFEGGRGVRTLATAGFFGTFAADYLTNVSCFFSEFLATAILLLVILAVTDKRNSPPPYGLLPLVIFILTLGIAACLGFAINPARDLGPRILTSMVGYGSAVYTFRNQYWIWCPIMAPFLGAMAATCFYDILLFNGEESIFNRSGAQTPMILDHEADDVV
uniref:Putative aquaporin 4 n=1 Tax=Moniliophthora roreri TaxID=221103 RepID=A0A0W0EVC4_MONRR